MTRCAWLLFAAHLLRCLLPAVATEQVKIYFGVGCFWHIQHAFYEAEKVLLGRNDSTVTSTAGYAGATKTGQACYYDDKVTAEVVGLEIPTTSVGDFAARYYSYFNGHDRSHANDKGPHYRACIGLPGGTSSPLFSAINDAQTVHGKSFDLTRAQGDDPDTLGGKIIWIYDSDVLPFYQAEIYHQFHDDYLPSGDYPDSYEILRSVASCDGRLKPTGCSKDDAAVLANLNCNKPTADAVKAGGSGGDSLGAAATSSPGTAAPSIKTGTGADTMKTTAEDNAGHDHDDDHDHKTHAGSGAGLTDGASAGSASAITKGPASMSANSGLALDAPTLLVAVCLSKLLL